MPIAGVIYCKPSPSPDKMWLSKVYSVGDVRGARGAQGRFGAANKLDRWLGNKADWPRAKRQTAQNNLINYLNNL